MGRELSEIQDVVEVLRHMGCLAWRNSTGAHRTRSGGWVKVGLGKGGPDVVGMLPGGRFLGLKLKLGDDRLKEHQREWLSSVRELGAAVAVVGSAREVADVVERFLAGDEPDPEQFVFKKLNDS